MNTNLLLRIAAGILVTGSAASATGIVYTCASSVDAAQSGTCAYLNSTIAGYYSSTFGNANADIYIQVAGSGLGSSTSGFYNFVSYKTYRDQLISTDSSDAIDSLALASLPAIEPSPYTFIWLTSALGAAVGLQNADLHGTTSDGIACTPGNSGCYNGIITIALPSSLPSGQSYYWDQNGGRQPNKAYDFYSVVQHETDEVLGTISCVTTSGSLADGCGINYAAAIDLFRYSSANTRVFDTSTPATQYFSYDGGVSNGAAGADFNPSANGNDYADFTTNCAHVQDAVGCLGSDLTILNDGGAEINMLDAIGYNRVVAPEPGTISLVAAGLALVGLYRRRRC